MSKMLMSIIAALVVAVGGFFFTLVPPLSWVWAAAVVALSFLAGVQWAVYTMASNPEKLARLVAKYLPEAEIRNLVGTGGFGDMVAMAKKKLGFILNE